MAIAFSLIFFVLGLIIGSFLNVVIFRLNTAKSLGGRSACMSCERKLRWYELIPVFSFLGLSGRCKGCKTKISIQYPLVELATGLVFASLFLKFSALGGSAFGGEGAFSPVFIFVYAFYAVIFSILLVVAVYDLRHKIIPDMLAFTFGALTFFGLFIWSGVDFSLPVLSLHIPTFWEFLSGVLIALPFAFFWLVSGGRWMGLGDAKLALGIGWLFAPFGISAALSALVIAFWSGAVIGIILVVVSKIKRRGDGFGRGMKSEVPFAPFLVFGAFISFIFGFNFFPLIF